jgi:hypothetical protein
VQVRLPGGAFPVIPCHQRTGRPLAWLTDTDVVYWGDIDTHGFAIWTAYGSGFPTSGRC